MSSANAGKETSKKKKKKKTGNKQLNLLFFDVRKLIALSEPLAQWAGTLSQPLPLCSGVSEPFNEYSGCNSFWLPFAGYGSYIT